MADQRRRNIVGGIAGYAMHKTFIKPIMARLTRSTKISVSMAFLVMSAEKSQRLTRIFFYPYSCLKVPPDQALHPLRDVAEPIGS